MEGYSDTTMRYLKLKSVWSRRDFLEAAAPALLANVVPASALALASEAGRRLAYVGSYTSAVDGGANGQGIYQFEVDTRSSAFIRRKLVRGFPIPPGLSFTRLENISTQ